MKLTITVLILSTLAGAASAQSFGTRTYGTGSNSSSHTVSPYINSHGTYVGGHHATNPNSTQTDNFGSRGNVNPYTGAIGTRSPRY